MGNELVTITPYSLIENAVQNAASVETIGKLMDLQERHEGNEARKAFFVAMQKFQGIKPELKKSSKVQYNKVDYKFCALPDIERALKEPLGECDLSYRFENGTTETQYSVTCIVSHVQGHSERTTMTAPADDSGNKNKIQGIGSSMTYLMRYTILAAFGLTTADEDDDGRSHSDLPMQRVLAQNGVLRDQENLRAVLAIKESLSEGDFFQTCEYMYEMPQEQLNALWLSPKAGGIFSTDERAKMKSDDFASVRADYFAQKEDK